MFDGLAGRSGKQNKFDGTLKTVLEFEALLIAAETASEAKVVLAGIVKNIQPISVGVWMRLPSSSELVLALQTLMRIEVDNFNSVFMSEKSKDSKFQDRTVEFDPGSD